jgi:MFS family permease
VKEGEREQGSDLPSASAGPPSRVPLLRGNAAFRSLWIARVVSFAGDQLTLVALVLLVHARHGTGMAVAALLFSIAAPRLLGPVAGAIADRMDQRRLMRACELGRAVVVAVIALTLPPFVVLIPLVVATAVLATLFMPAGRSALPVVVQAQDLQQANAFLATGYNVGLAVGPAIGGVLVATVGTSGALLVDALTSLVAVTVLARLPRLPPERTPDAPTPGLSADVLEGLRVIARHAIVRRVTLGLILGVSFAAVGNVAGVFLIRDALGGGPTSFGVFTAAWGMGMILGSLLIARWARAVDPSRLFAGGWALSGLGLLGAGSAPRIALAVGAYGLGGVGNGLENVATDTLIQRTVERRMLGRVFGAVYAGAFVGDLVAYAVTGPLIDTLSPRILFLTAGAGTLLVAGWLVRSLPRVEARSTHASRPASTPRCRYW